MSTPQPEALSGVALAEAVAVEVMGHQIQRTPLPFGQGDCVYEVEDGIPLNPAHYSTHIWDAWLVVRWMQAQGWFFVLSTADVHAPDAATARHYALFSRDATDFRDPDDSLLSFGDTAPEAICRAALNAVRAAGGRE